MSKKGRQNITPIRLAPMISLYLPKIWCRENGTTMPPSKNSPWNVRISNELPDFCL